MHREFEAFQIDSDGHRLVGDLYEARASTPQKGDMILAHGGGQIRHYWRKTADSLSNEGSRVITCDTRGHGESDWRLDSDYDHGGHRADLTAITTLCESAPVLVGASLGGTPTLRKAGGEPDLVRSAAPQAQLVDISDVGHISAGDDNDRFTAPVKIFLSELE